MEKPLGVKERAHTTPQLLFITVVMQHFETMMDTNWVMAKYFLH